MTIRELIDELEAIAAEAGDDIEVRLAQQPSWPFEYSIAGVHAVPQEDDASADAVYLSEGQQLGYLPGEATRALGWERSR